MIDQLSYVTAIIDAVNHDAGFSGPCWGCGNCVAHDAKCPTLSPRPMRYVKKRLEQTRSARSVAFLESSDTTS